MKSLSSFRRSATEKSYELVTARLDSPDGGLAAIIARNTQSLAAVSADGGEADAGTAASSAGAK